MFYWFRLWRGVQSLLNTRYLRYLVKMKHHISYFYNALFKYYPLHEAEWQTRLHNPPDWGLVSSVATCLAHMVCHSATCVWDQSSWHRLAVTASTACVAWLGAVADWWRSGPMANVLACLCWCQWQTFWTYFVTINLFFLYLMNFMFHTMLDVVCNIQRVHYKSMKCDVFLFTS